MAGEKTFVCFAPEDTERTLPVLAALDAWEVTHTENTSTADRRLTPAAQQAIRECTIFVRICTGATLNSSLVNQATDQFRQLLARDRQEHQRDHKKLVNLILDPAYQLQPADLNTLYITTQGKTRALWLEELSVPLGVATLTQRVNRRALLGLGATGALTLLSGATAGELLIQQRHAAQTLPGAPLPNVATVSGQPKWTASVSQSINSSLYPVSVVFDGYNLYAHSDTTLTQLSPTTGKQKEIALKFPITSSKRSQFILANGYAIINTFDQNVGYVIHIIHVPSGVEAWQIENVLDYLTATIDGGRLYVLVAIGEPHMAKQMIHTYSLQDGTPLWQTAFPWKIASGTNPSQMTISDHRLYIGSSDHHLYCFDAQTGKQIWRFLARGEIYSSPTVANGIVYFGAEDGYIYAVDAQSGVLRWRYQTEAGVESQPSINDGVLYVGSNDNYLYALDALSGKHYWRSYIGANEQLDLLSNLDISTKPIVYRSIVCISTYAGVYAFEIKDGTQRWPFTIHDQDSTSSQAVVVNDLIIFGTPAQQVIAVNP